MIKISLRQDATVKDLKQHLAILTVAVEDQELVGFPIEPRDDSTLLRDTVLELSVVVPLLLVSRTGLKAPATRHKPSPLKASLGSSSVVDNNISGISSINPIVIGASKSGISSINPIVIGASKSTKLHPVKYDPTVALQAASISEPAGIRAPVKNRVSTIKPDLHAPVNNHASTRKPDLHAPGNNHSSTRKPAGLGISGQQWPPRKPAVPNVGKISPSRKSFRTPSLIQTQSLTPTLPNTHTLY